MIGRWRKKLTDAEVTELSQRLAELSSSQAPLADGLRAASKNVSNFRVRMALQRLADHIASGGSVARGVAHTKLGLPTYLTGLIYAGTQTGRLPNVLSGLASHYRERRRWKQRIWLALAYPLCTLVLMSIIAGILFGAVVPAFRDIYTDFDTDLAPATEMMFWFSEVGWKYLSYFLLACLSVCMCIRLIGGPAAWRRLVASCPGFGKLFHWHGMLEFFKLLKFMLDVETPLPEALKFTSHAIRDDSVAELSAYISQHVERGKSFSSAIRGEVDIPGGIEPVIKWGEENGQLSNAMDTATEILEGRLQLRTRFIMSVLPPLMFVCVGGFVIVLVYCLLLPMIGLISAIN